METGADAKEERNDVLGDFGKSFKDALDLLADCVFVKDAGGRYRIVNKSMLRQLGLIEDQIVGKCDYEIFSPMQHNHIHATDLRVLRGEQVTDEHGGFKGIEDAILHVVKTPYRGRDGEIVGIVGVARDVTMEREAQRKILENEEWLKALFEYSPSMLFLVDKNGIIKRVNEAGAQKLGFTTDELKGLSVLKVFPERNHQVVITQIELCLENPGKNYSWEIQKKKKGGQEIWVCEEAKVIADPNNQDNRLVFIVCQDITDKKDAEQAVKESEERLRLIFEKSTGGELIVEGGVFTEVNRKALEILGARDRSEILGKNPAEISPKIQPDGSDSYLKAKLLFEKAEQSGSASFEWVHRGPSGRDVCIEVALTSYSQKGKKFFHTSWKDLTEKRRLEEEKGKLEAQLRQAQKMESIGNLAAGVAHDFNNLLTVMRGYATLICQSNEIDRIREYAGRIENSVEKGTSITRQLLAFSRRQVFNMGLADLNDLLVNSKNLLPFIGEDISITIEACGQPLLVNCDSAQIEGVITNLAVNSMHAMPDGGKIFMKTERVLDERINGILGCSGHLAHVSFSDTGEGMSGEVMESIFEPFFTTKGKDKGTGLGLAVVYGIVRQHNGHIEVKSELGKGTTFDIYFPLAESEETKQEKKLPGENLLSKIGKGRKILVVEDNDDVRKVTKDILEILGFEVLDAIDTLQAEKIITEKGDDISLILSDVVLPKENGGTNGVEFVLKILSRYPKIKIILASGYTEDKSQENVIQNERIPFLQKPFFWIDLQKKIKEVLGE